MILITQLLIIIAALGLLLFGLTGRASSAGRAWKKIGLSLLVFAMVVAVLFPRTIDSLAHALGIGRGADLLLYCVTIAFIAYALNSYLHQQDEKDALYRLARKVALLEANEHYNLNKDDKA